MKNYILLTLVTLIYCKSESKSSKSIDNPGEIQVTEATGDTDNDTDTKNNLAALTQKIFTAAQRNSDNNFSQKLSVNWVSEKIVEYRLIFDNKSCSETIGGRATAIKSKNDPFYE